MISPNNSSKKVRITVNIRNSANGEWNTNTFIKKKLQSMIMVTFTKLLVINIVANKRSESSRRKLIFSSAGCLRSSISFLSEGESEKKAISEAEAKPEASRSTPASTMAIIAEIEGVFTVIPLKISANWLK
ncbi:hypothetical protein BACCAC_02371 [Bacteroides caccae ATCC 43185]|nr:hypothetical protein BACCAC_02371 [Bacteroides caccae ATCC 43185]